ncbi:response regulator transcription factor [Neorhizobium alkalisoli]|uniref:Response regulator receiver domain-containing protein n=1 Tax=Neorhizobium alkalisoli TaxID=528178 RepID=A0A561QPI2_9HYPH|nr:response regulator [Neorhizobium alkalisoli]TWF52267.1 response regulator receiver domain-containing protein [Neorhizobium alkalisoli]
MPSTQIIGIVDDDEDLPAALSSLVRSLGYGAECFSSASALLARKDLDTFSCVISDIHMPVMDGIALAQKLGEIAADLPVILMTGRNEEGLERKAYAAGAICFMPKPFSFDDLSRSLDKALAAKG